MDVKSMLKDKKIMITVISLLLWILFVSTGYVSYDVNDDSYMNLVAAGALGTGRSFLVYTNILLGLVFQFLFTIFPHINCYLWFYLVFDLLAVIAICQLLTENMKLRTAIVTTVGINLLMAGEFYVHLTYTKSAALYGTVGLVLLLWQINKAKRQKGFLALAYILVTVGIWARWKSFALCVPMVIGIELIDILINGIQKKERPSLKKYIPVFVAGAICVASILTDSFVYKMDAGWDEYRKLDNLIIEMRDNNRYVFSDAPDEYLAVGITENDFKMIKGYWMWNDPTYFNSDRLQQIKDIGSKYEDPTIRFELVLIKDTVKEILWILEGKSYGIIFAILLLLAIIYGNKTLLLKAFYLSAVASGEIYYMCCLNRVLWRAEICVVLTAVIALGYLLTDLIPKNSDKSIESSFISYFVIAVVCVAFIAGKSLLVDNTRFTNGDSKYEEFQTLRQTDSFFVVQSLSDYGMLMGAKDIFDMSRAESKDYYRNTVALGGSSPSPSGMFFARQNGVNNPIKDLIDGDNIYYVGEEEPREMLAAFMDEKYGPGLVWEPVTVGEVKAYKVSSGK